MLRRPPVLAAFGALALVTALAAPSANATQAHHAPARGGHPSSVRVERGTTAAFSSVALFATKDPSFQVAKGVSASRPAKTATLVASGNQSVATGITPDGEDGLLCNDDTGVYPVDGLRQHPVLEAPLDGTVYSDEGGDSYGFYCDGVALQGSFALVTGDSQGVLQLTHTQVGWAVDTRVQSAGLNEAGNPHQPGWIRFPGSTSEATTYNNVSIAPRALPDGQRLAIAIDRQDATIAVIKGVGSSTPRTVGLLQSGALHNSNVNDANGGVAWQPHASNRVVVVTKAGFAVLDLSHPSKPRLTRFAKVAGGTAPASITISSDGDHLAVAAANRIYGYDGVGVAVAQGRKFKLQTTFRLAKGPAERVSDVAYTSNDTLAVLHGKQPDDWALTLVKKVTQGHHTVKGSTSVTAPTHPGSLSVWPAP